MEKKASLGIALSGGGHRATAFGLGVLLYLADCGVNAQVTAISSVSGGSLLNSYVALLDKPFNRLTAAEFDERAAVLARRIAGNPRWWWAVASLIVLGFVSAATLALSSSVTPFVPVAAFVAFLFPCAWLGSRSGGSVWGWWGAWMYFGFLMALPLVGLAFWVASDHRSVWWGTSELLALFLLLGSMLGQRHVITGLAFGATMRPLPSHRPVAARQRRGPARLEDMTSEVRHVLCATEMHAGTHAYFSHDLIYSRGFGLGRPGGLPIRAAVQCSANFPGGFPLRVLRTRRFAFELTDRRDWHPLSRFAFEYDKTDPPPKWMVLSDGGVFDNLADAWFLEGRDRASRLDRELDKRRRAKYDERLAKAGKKEAGAHPDHDPVFTKTFYRRHRDLVDRIESIRKAPVGLIVVNAGTSVPWSAVRRVGVPFVGEAFGFVKVADVMYRNTTSSRVRDLIARFAARIPLGAVVDMSDDPMSLIDRSFDQTPEEKERVSRARQARESRVVKTFVLDAQIADDKLDLTPISAAVPTTLQPLGVATTASLLYHGYVQAMLALHVQLGFPLLDPLPDPEPFVRLARGGRRQSLPTVSSAGDPDPITLLGDVGKAERLIADARRALSVAKYDEVRCAASGALDLVRSGVGEDDVRAAAFELLGHAALADGVFDVAREWYEQALPIYRNLGGRRGEADTLRGLGDLELRQANPNVARERYDRAWSLHSSAGDRLGQAHTSKSLGDLEAAENNLSRAIELYDYALNVYAEEGYTYGQAVAFHACGLALQRNNELAEARRAFKEALRLYREMGDEQRASALLKVLDDLGPLSAHE